MTTYSYIHAKLLIYVCNNSKLYYRHSCIRIYIAITNPQCIKALLQITIYIYVTRHEKIYDLYYVHTILITFLVFKLEHLHRQK